MVGCWEIRVMVQDNMSGGNRLPMDTVSSQTLGTKLGKGQGLNWRDW
jgi:hypothetical protein